MREPFDVAVTVRSCSKLLAWTCVLAAGAWALTQAAIGTHATLGTAVAGLPVVNSVTVVAGALIAYLLYSRGSAEHDDRLRWLATGYAVSTFAMAAHLLGFPTFAGGGPLRTSSEGTLALFLLAHTAVAGCALLTLWRPTIGGRWRRRILVTGYAAALYCAIGAFPLPLLIDAQGRFTPAGIAAHVLVTVLTGWATYRLWAGRVARPLWAQPLLVASFGCSTWEMVFHSVSGGRYSALWWAAVAMKLAEFAVLAVGLLLGLLALTRTLERFTDDLLQRLAGEEPTASAVPPMTATGFPARASRTPMGTIIDLREVSPVFQPVVDLGTGRTVGMEALARFPSRPGVSPAVVFAQAAREGLAKPLELAAVQKALERLPDLDAQLWLAINLSPATIASPELADLLNSPYAPRLVVEITEHVPVPEYDALTAALRRLKARGVRVAVDDAGAGFSTFRHVVRLRPDIIKLDISLTTGIDTDPVRRALASSIITFAGSMQSLIVAEGIETRQEREALAGLGVPLGQGYLLGRPAELPLLSHVS